MPPALDDIETLSEVLACEIAGLAPATRRDWVKKGLLDQPARGAKLSERQVLELALVRELHDCLGPRDAAIAWKEIGDDLHNRLLTGTLDVVVDLGYREAALVTDDRALATAVRTGRPVCVVSMTSLVARVRASFRRLAPPLPAGRARRERGRGVKDAS